MHARPGYHLFHRCPEQDAVLEAIVSRAKPGTVGIFDLDGCALDNRPRQIRILREAAAHLNLPELCQVSPEHYLDWSMSKTLIRAGISAGRVEQILQEVEVFWTKRFFDSNYAVFDHPAPGSPSLVRRCHDAGMHILYLTARAEKMRDGTARTLRQFSFPWDDRTELVLKQPGAGSDEGYKVAAVKQRALLGDPVVFVDNEPANVNAFQQHWPSALVVFVDTDHSPRPIEPDASLPRVRGFLQH